MRKKPVSGQTLYQLTVHRSCPPELIPVRVVSVGRKYFSCSPDGQDSWRKTEYYLEDWSEKTEYASNKALFESEQEYQDWNDHAKISEKLRGIFGKFGRVPLSVETLRKIMALVDEESARVKEGVLP